MPTIVCPVSITCPGSDDPISNYSSEVPDVINFEAIGYPTFNPDTPIGDDPRDPLPPPISSQGCLTSCVSGVSRADAIACARVDALLCQNSNRSPAPVNAIAFNDAQSCSIPCSGGAPATVVIPAGYVAAPNKAIANSIAHSIACQRAAQGVVPISNSEQCFTARCPNNDPFSVQRCTPAGTYGECLIFPTAAQIAAAQQFFDDFALAAATADANQALQSHVCQTCNAEVSGFASCPGDPTKIANATVPKGKYCLPPGGSQDQVDAQASQDLYNQTQAGLKALGCACFGAVDPVTQIPSFTCDTFIQVLNGSGSAFPAPLNGSPGGSGIFHVTPGNFDWQLLWRQSFGCPDQNPCFHGIVRILGISYTAPEIRLFFP